MNTTKEETNQHPDTPHTVSQFSEKYPAFPLGSIRHIIFHSKNNGFRKAIRRIGRRVYIIPSAFFECVEELNK